MSIKSHLSPGLPLTARARAEIESQLEALDTDLVRRRKRLAYWTTRKAQAASMPHLPEDLRADTMHFHKRALDLVMSGEMLAAMLRKQLQEAIAEEPVYH